ncbi:DUF2169 domain-containing protein [Enhygromyxa salina]|uniref:DUF2169 domain-containing protein n=1 Tax=Enhygromyxa salina TaxID=215803 RepID=UPI000D08914B
MRAQFLLAHSIHRARPATRSPSQKKRHDEHGARCRNSGTRHNPVGEGLVPSFTSAVDRALPNIEDPNQLIQSPSDLPIPAGFGPIARHWGPRRVFAGTYDDAWATKHAPLWPADLDERFFRAASPGLQAPEHLVGGEPVRLVGLHPDGAIEFAAARLHLAPRSLSSGPAQE